MFLYKNHIHVQVPCVICHKNVEIEMTEYEYENFQKWQDGEIRHIQDAIPTVSAENREMFISGICSKCWRKNL